VKKVSLQAKKAYFEKTRLVNYQASMRLEGIKSASSSSSRKSGNGLTREEILEKYRSAE
jgi:hypothetical protein